MKKISWLTFGFQVGGNHPGVALYHSRFGCLAGAPPLQAYSIRH